MEQTPLSECIAPSFYDLHKTLKSEKISELWMRGGRGSTKSSFTSIEIILGILKDPEANAVVFRRYENEIRDSVFGQMQWALNKLNVDQEFKSYVSPFKLVYLRTGQVILFKGADNPKKLKSIKLPTGYMKYAWFEEVDQFSGMEEIRNIQQSIFRGTTKKQIAFYSYNPPKSARSWANAETKIDKPGRVVHYSDYRSVPADWLGATFLQNAEHLKEVNPEAYEHEYLGKETGTGLEVFTNVTLRPISDKEISQFDHRSQGLDFGYAADPLCFLEGHFDNKRKRLYLFDEISGVGIKNAEFAARLSEQQRVEVTMADSSEPKSIDELRDEHRVNVVPVQKSPGSVEHGIKYMQDLEEIIIDPSRCPLAAKEFINYALDTNRYGDVISKYPDKDNHCFVGETLISTTKGNRRIDEIQPGEMVITRKGPRRVNKVFQNGNLPTVTVRLLNGKSLTLTDTHEIITGHGKKMFKHLTSRDTVFYEEESCRFIETENRKLPYLRAKSIAATQKAKEEMTGYTSNARSRLAQTNTFTWQYMKTHMGLFLRGTTYTIKMGTLSIMISAISSALVVQNTFRGTLWSITRVIKTLFGKTWIESDPLLNNGMVLMKGLSGIGSMAVTCSGTVKWSNEYVITAEKPMKSMSFLQRAVQDSALIIASRPIEKHPVWMMWNGFVKAVGKRLLSISIPPRGSVTGDVQAVYDLEVEGEHEYFANGLLVSNSIDCARYLLNLQIIQAKKERWQGKFKTKRIPTINRW